MPKADLFTHENSSVISIATTYQDRHLMTELPGGRFNRQLQGWLAPLSWATCVTLRGLFGDRLEIGEDLQAWAWETRNSRIEPAYRIRNLLELPPDMPFPELDEVEEGRPLKLFPYQRVDVKFLLLNERALLANEPGLGKTGVLIRFLQVLKHLGREPFPAVVICPNSLKFAVWEGEFAAWAPEINVQVVDGSAGKRRKQLANQADVYVINWDSVRLHSRMAAYGSINLSDNDRLPKELNELNPRVVLMDEAHRLKSPQTAWTRAAWAVAHQARYRVAATGTPVTDHVGDWWSLGHALEPTWLPAKTKFMDRYAQVSLNFFGGAEVVGINPNTKDELFSIIDPLTRRVPKKLALPQLPPKLPPQIRHTPMATKQQKAYDQMREQMLAMLDGGLLVAGDDRVKFLRLMQFAAASAELVTVTKRVPVRTERFVEDLDPRLTLDDLYDDDDDFVHPLEGKTVTDVTYEEREVTQVRLTSPSAKVDDLVDLLEEMGEAPLVVAAVSRQLIELAGKKLEQLKIPHGYITGAQTPAERRVAMNSFQAGNIRVILLTLGAGAEGITLTRADTMLFMQEDFSEVTNQQAQDRVYRIGSEIHASIRIIKQITPGSVEERKLELLEGKRIRMEEILRDEDSIRYLLGG
jgi:SNF2 family DNA or RNA helicase